VQYAGRTPTRERITVALDAAGLFGPDVDVALGGLEPMVGEWEAGTRVPTFAQVELLAAVTTARGRIEVFSGRATGRFRTLCGSRIAHGSHTSRMQGLPNR
jgi:hypothetical protein